MRTVIPCCLVLVLTFSFKVQAQDAGPGSVTIERADQTKSVLKAWKIIHGARRLGVEGAKGPEYLEFREDTSTRFQEGITTFVQMSCIRRIQYDKAGVSVTVALPEGKETVLKGPTRFEGINKLVIAGEIDLGAEGKASSQYQGGDDLVAFRFAGGQTVPAEQGPVVSIVGVDEQKTVHKVHDLKVLYAVQAGERLSNFLKFEPKAKIDLATIRGLSRKSGKEFVVTRADASPHQWTLITSVLPDDDSPATLVGLIGRVPAGYKLFPLHTIAELRRE